MREQFNARNQGLVRQKDIMIDVNNDLQEFIGSWKVAYKNEGPKKEIIKL